MIRQSNLDLTQIRYLKPNLGRKFSDEVNKKKGLKGIKNCMSNPDVKTKHKIIMANMAGSDCFSHKGGSNPSANKVKVNNLIYDCMNDVAKFYAVSRKTIRSWLNGAKPNKIHDIYFIGFVTTDNSRGLA